jgi:DNA mismatch endonuclease, patch repair protein
MPDVFSKEKRSRIMSRIKGKDTKPEKLVRSLLHRMGYRFRLHVRDLPGNPDIVLPRHRKIVFMNGCFWHGHPNCKRAKLPETNRPFWEEKIGKNMKRDRSTLRKLRKTGWRVLVVWQCEMRDKTMLENSLRRFMEKR